MSTLMIYTQSQMVLAALFTVIAVEARSQQP